MSVDNDEIVLPKALNENFDFEGFFSEVNDVFVKNREPVRLNCEKLDTINSVGIVSWLKNVKESQIPFHYKLVRAALVAQFNMLATFFDDGLTFVESIEIPLYRIEDDEPVSKFVKLGSELPLGLDDEQLEVFLEERYGEIYELEFLPESYLQFLKNLTAVQD